MVISPHEPLAVLRVARLRRANCCHCYQSCAGVYWCAVQLEEVVNVHKKHVQALEKALRCLDNDAVSSEELDPLKDDLEYYLVRACGGWGTSSRFQQDLMRRCWASTRLAVKSM